MKKPRTFKKIILEDLKNRSHDHLIKKIKSITYETFSMGNAVRVKTLDMFKGERDLLDSILKEYQYGRFDAMTDCAYSERNDKMERQAKYVTLSNEFSEVFQKLAKTIGQSDKNFDSWQFLYRLESYDQAIELLDNYQNNLIANTKETLKILRIYP